MAKKLVIVESPAKAKTIGSYLGPDFEVQASIGHIRDLTDDKGLPEEHRKKWWADYAVDIDNGFEPFYAVPKEKEAQVAKLRAAMKGKEELVLATDEDREGESISWHLLKVLKPSKQVKVSRIAFHEITRDAIQRALAAPRQVDEDLVEAQEARRILDRLYGYTLSPVLWSKVTKNLSAGRVQTPAVKLVVEREEQRRRFRSGSYWDLKARLLAGEQAFDAELRRIDGTKVASGADFDDSTGELKAKNVRLLDEAAARALVEAARPAKPWTVRSVESKPGTERPAPPFMTTTLQQDANRKFGFSADRTMRIAQTLYEGVDIGGEQVGLITYMRTDSLSLSSDAVKGIRDLIAREYRDCLPEKPNHYTSKVRNAQEAHEAIRPTDANRRPTDVARFLSEDQRKLYDLIWKRAVASQMKPAEVTTTRVEVGVEAAGSTLGFEASGKVIRFDGFRRLYLEGKDDSDAERESAERRLPNLVEGQEVGLEDLQALGHETKPPARYTDATLIKKLEDLGIGRPSTYASIIATIVDRGYVRKAGKQLVPTWKAFLTMDVLETGFGEFMEYDFTRKMDEALDDIAGGKASRQEYLHEFFMGGDGKQGLKPAVDARKREIPFPKFSVGNHPDSGEPILVRTGKSGEAFLQLGDNDSKKYANVPDDLAPADLTVQKAVELLAGNKAEAESVGVHPQTGRRLLLKQRQGFYLEVERTPEEIQAKVKPTWISVPPGCDPRTLTQEELDFLCQLPKVIGTHPETGQEITFHMGRYGPYIKSGDEIRNVEDWRSAASMSVEGASEVLALPKYVAQRRAAVPKAGPIQDFGEQPDAAGPVRVLSGRFGPYVTDGTTNATLPKNVDPATISVDDALDLLRKKREAGPSTRRPVRRKVVRKKK